MDKPYYADDTVALYLGDCRQVLPTLPRESVDLIVTDPPYGVGWRSGLRINRHDRIAGDDRTLDVAAALGLALKLLRNRRHIYVFGRHDLSALRIGGTCELIWDKAILGPGDLSLPWGPSHEPITFAAYCQRPSNRANGAGRLSARLRQGSVLRVPRLNAGALEDRHDRHPTEKPVALLRQLIESSSLLGDTVLDPFAGAGSTLLAARIEGRQAIGVEIDERWCEVAVRRLSQALLT